MTFNRLQYEKSLYLQQHSTNPIHWFPWCEEAFDKAKKEDKLILISIGYSSCHWCHVMEKEVFENEDAAELLNRHFICIKVDREERPDVDNSYMTAVQLMTQSGGWPLNCFALPDGRPVFGGTYFPLEHFMNILQSLNDLYKNDKDKMLEYATQLTEGMNSLSFAKMENELTVDEEKIHLLVENWSKTFDWYDGGTKRAPKFPLPNNYDFLLQYGQFYGEENVVKFTHFTLHKILQGGIYDQIEGGLMRYSTDMYWKEPHFEKMLYDNVQFLSVLAKAHIDEPSLDYQFTIEQTLEWLDEKMRTEHGFYKSSIDADADGEEGGFYVWKKEELKNTLLTDYDFFENNYPLDGTSFWKNDNYILLRNKSYNETIENKNYTSSHFINQLKRTHSLLRVERAKRVAPTIDNKVIFSWNCMTAISLLDIAISFNKILYVNHSIKLFEVLTQKFISEDKIYRINDGQNKIHGFLDDYAYFVSLCIKLHQCTLDETWLITAKKWLGIIEKRFERNGNLFYYAENDPLLVSKSLEIEDNVIPSSNSILANCYWDLGVLFANENWLNIARKMLHSVYEGMENYGSGYSNWAILLLKINRGDLLVSYLDDIPLERHYEQLRKLQSITLFKRNQLGNKTNTFEVCHALNCQLPVVGYENIYSEVVKIIS